MRSGYWPVVLYLRRCRAIFLSPGGTAASRERCDRLIWPWQDIRRTYDPECGGELRHHACLHRETQALWQEPDDNQDHWKRWLSCEHRVETVVE